MKDRMTTGLVSAGGVIQSFLARMPALLGSLGPVKGFSLRVSRRIANGLKAGVGVGDYSAFRDCGSIWIAVPENMLDTVSADLAREVPVRGKMIVLCDVIRDSLCPSPLRTSGARVATLNCMPESGGKIFVAEGNRDVLAMLRRLLAQDGYKLIELQPVSKPLYWSGIFLGGHVLFPWIAGAVESLRAAGFTRGQATRSVQAMGGHALRSYARAGSKAWNRAEASRLQEQILKDFDAIRFTHPRVAALYLDNVEHRLPPGPVRKRTARRAGRIDTPASAQVASF